MIIRQHHSGLDTPFCPCDFEQAFETIHIGRWHKSGAPITRGLYQVCPTDTIEDISVIFGLSSGIGSIARRRFRSPPPAFDRADAGEVPATRPPLSVHLFEPADEPREIARITTWPGSGVWELIR
jgi:hypothetical protein